MVDNLLTYYLGNWGLRMLQAATGRLRIPQTKPTARRTIPETLLGAE